MIQILPAFSPEIPHSASIIAQELESSINKKIPDKLFYGKKFNVLALNIIAVNPDRGAIPGGVKMMRSQGALWSYYNIDFDQFVKSNERDRSIMMREASVSAVNQVDSKYIDEETRGKIISAILSS